MEHLESKLKMYQKLINACNKITIERDWLNDMVEVLENNKERVYNVIKPELKFEKTLIDNFEATVLLCASTQMLYFNEIFSRKEYIDKVLDLFDIQEECRNTVEYVFNYSIYQYVKEQNNEIKLITNILNLTDVLTIIDKNLEDENLEHIVAEYIHNTTDLDLQYCEYIAPDIIEHF